MILNPHSSESRSLSPANRSFTGPVRGDLKSVCRPLDFRNVDTVFVHIPQRRQSAQLGNGLADFLRGVVDFFFGGETTEGKTDRAMRQFVVAAQGAQYIRRLERRRGASRAGRHSQI